MEDYPDLLVGLGPADDAAVWRLDETRLLVATTDFFTPVVDDAYDYGAIAAANALSDLYAMGTRPTLALNLVGYPVKSLRTYIRKRVEAARVVGKMEVEPWSDTPT